MRLTRCCAVLAAVALGTASHIPSATTILFDFQAADPQNSATFTLDSAALPSATSTNWTQFKSVTVTQQSRSFTETVNFGNKRWGGGFSFLSSPAFDFFGAMLFTGTVAQPQFTFGNYALKSNVDGKLAGTLIISQFIAPAPQIPPVTTPAPPPSAAVPEPGSWALLLLGFAAMGAMLRRRKPAVRSVRFSTRGSGNIA